LHNELSTLDRGSHEIEVIQDSQRRNAAWIGGSMFASLPTFAMMKVTKQEFEENPQNIHKKYF
jgi:actin-related protein